VKKAKLRGVIRSSSNGRKERLGGYAKRKKEKKAKRGGEIRKKRGLSGYGFRKKDQSWRNFGAKIEDIFHAIP